jgi:predicted alpha/beta-hydrolase family hydrolase
MSEVEQTTSTLASISDNALATVIFAHGAGADMNSDFMENITAKLTNKQINVIRFNFPYMDKRKEDGKRRPPDRMPKLLACFEDVLSDTDNQLPIFLMGKSMGGRVAATMAERLLSCVKGVICLGYPFHPPKKLENTRLTPLQESKLPMLIIQGERDALGNKQEVNGYQLPEHCHCVFMPDGDHDLKPRVKSGYTHQQHIESAINEIVRFINES